MKPSFLTLLISFLFSAKVFAAACCGGGFGLPSVITGDERAQLTTVVSYSQIEADVYGNGLWRKRDQEESSRTFRIEGAHLLSDRWQAGASIPIIQRDRAGQSSSGLGDMNGSLGFEFLPEWEFSAWRPKGTGYFQVTAPSGKSIYESDSPLALDSRGRGFWALGLGAVFTKTFGKWDGYSSFEVHRALPKKSTAVQGTLYPGWGGNTTVGAGYNLRDWRAGASVAWSLEDPVDVRGESSSDGQEQRFATGVVSLSYLANEEWAATASYSDQTRFGSPANTSLSKSVSIQIQRRWAR